MSKQTTYRYLRGMIYRPLTKQQIKNGIKTNIPMGHITLSFKPANQHSYAVGVSFCSPRDQFSKSLGRELAESRKTVTIHSSGAKDYTRMALRALTAVYSAGKYPQWAEQLIAAHMSKLASEVGL